MPDQIIGRLPKTQVPDISADSAFVLKQPIQSRTRQSKRVKNTFRRKVGILQICLHVAAYIIEHRRAHRCARIAGKPCLLREGRGEQLHSSREASLRFVYRNRTNSPGQGRDMFHDQTHHRASALEHTPMEGCRVGNELLQKRTGHEERNDAASLPAHSDWLVHVERQNSFTAEFAPPPGRVHDERLDPAFQKHVKGETANVVPRYAGNRTLQQQLVRPAIRKDDVIDNESFDRPVKRLFGLGTRSHDVYDVPDTLAPAQQLPGYRLISNIEMAMNDPVRANRCTTGPVETLAHG